GPLLVELPGIEPAPEIALSCINAEFDYAKVRTNTPNDLRIRASACRATERVACVSRPLREAQRQARPWVAYRRDMKPHPPGSGIWLAGDYGTTTGSRQFSSDAPGKARAIKEWNPT